METHDTVLRISIPNSHELSRNISEEEPREGSHRSKAANVLKGTFGSDYWTLSEGRSLTDLELKVAVTTKRLEEFRAKIAELGFAEVKKRG